MQRINEINFVIAVWMIIIGCALQLFYFATGFPASLKSVYTLQNETLIWSASAAVTSLLAWFFYYKDNEGHVLAFIIGFYILIPVAGALISASVYNITFSKTEEIFLGYIGLSHISYSLIEWRRVFSALGIHGNTP